MRILKNEKAMFGLETCVLFIFFLAVFFYHQTGFTLVHDESSCLLRYLTGYYCPACGGTRAFEALIHFRPVKSFLYHPVVLYMFIVIAISWGSYILMRITKGIISFYPLKLQHLIYVDTIFIVVFCIRNLSLYFWGTWMY